MARASDGDPQGLPERPAAGPGPGRIELQLAAAGYNAGSCAGLTPGQARGSRLGLPGLAGSAPRRRGADARATCRGVRAAVVRHLVSGK